MGINRLDGVLRHLRKSLASPTEGTDAELLRRFAGSRDAEAFAELVGRHGRMVFGICRRVLGDHHDAEDAFQATFLVLARRAESLRGRCVVAAWLHGVARRTALAARRSAAVRRAKERASATPVEKSAPADAPAPDLAPLLDHELRLLPERYRAPVVLCDLEGLTRREAARRLGWSEGTLSGRLFRARAILARRLSRHGLAVVAGALAGLLSEAGAAPPAALASATVRAVAGLGTQAASTAAIILAEGMMKTMLLAKLKGVAVIVALGCLAAGGAVGYRAVATEPGPDDPTAPRLAAGAQADKPATPKAKEPAPDVEKLLQELQALRREAEAQRQQAQAAEQEARRALDLHREAELQARKAAEAARADAEARARTLARERAQGTDRAKLLEVENEKLKAELMQARTQLKLLATQAGDKQGAAPNNPFQQPQLEPLLRERADLVQAGSSLKERLEQVEERIKAAQSAAGRAAAEPATGRRPNAPLSAAARPAKAGGLSLKAYQVEELVTNGRGGIEGSSELINLVTQMVAPESWNTQGGGGTIAFFAKTRTLFVYQTGEVHEQVKDMLDHLRKLSEARVQEIRQQMEKMMKK